MFVDKDQFLIMDENPVLQLAAISVIGHREEQQDSFGYHLEDNSGLMVVCDGMGGHQGGKQASRLAVQTFDEACEGRQSLHRSDALIGIAKEADRRIALLKNEAGESLRAGSTMVAISVDGRSLMWCAVGDSRAYLLRHGEMVQLTQDHNYRTVLVGKRNAGILSQEEFDREIVRGEALISFLGIGNLSLIDYSGSSLELEQDDRIILMSDGLYKVVTEEEIRRILTGFGNIAEALQAMELQAERNAKTTGAARDNMTAALIKIK